MIVRAPKTEGYLTGRRVMPRTLDRPPRMPLLRTLDPIAPRAAPLSRTKVSGILEDIAITRSDARNKMDQVKTAAAAFDENMGQWALAKSGGEDKAKIVHLPFGGTWIVPMVLEESDENFLTGWNTWYLGYQKFYAENYDSLAIDPTKSAANDYHQAEKYELQLGEWRTHLALHGGTVTAPKAVTDKELEATKPEPFPLKTVLWVAGAGVVVYGLTVVVPLASKAIGSSRRSSPRSSLRAAPRTATKAA
jgi:hypothetical protein